MHAWIKKFPFQLRERFILKKKKGKKKFFSSPVTCATYFSWKKEGNLQLLSQQFHIFPLFPPQPSVSQRFSKLVSSYLANRGGEGGVGERKIHVCFLDSNWQDGGRGDRLEKFSFETRLSFSLPISAPHLFIVVDLSRHSTPLLFPPGSTTWFEKIELVSNWISYSVSWRVFLIISIRWKCLLGRRDVSKRVHSTTRRSIIPSRGGSTVRLFLF